MKKILFMIAALLMLTALFTGCAGNNAAQGSPQASQGNDTLSAEDVAFAEPLVDNMLAGIRDKDYAVFSRDFSDATKSLMTEDKFNELTDLLASKIGDYEQRSFTQAVKAAQNDTLYTAVAYTAKYSDEPGDVIITVTFNPDQKIEGLRLDSPKLREQ
jgi:hypothetical protein